jgi:hypothetical protein
MTRKWNGFVLAVRASKGKLSGCIFYAKKFSQVGWRRRRESWHVHPSIPPPGRPAQPAIQLLIHPTQPQELGNGRRGK